MALRDDADLLVNLVDLELQIEELEKQLPTDDDAEYNYTIEEIKEIFKRLLPHKEYLKHTIKNQTTLIDYNVRVNWPSAHCTITEAP